MKEINDVLLVKQLAKKSVDIHCHGVGRFDFTEVPKIDLLEIEKILSERERQVILTLYLPKNNFEAFLSLIETFNQGKKAGKYKHIKGFGLEGPMLASPGGTPKSSTWVPSKMDWKKLADCGKKGLIYIIFSPDAPLTTNENFSSIDKSPSSVAWIAETLLDGGVLPTPGHFTKNDPKSSAKALQSVFDVVAAWGYGPTITDHLFNDMPHNFKHAWRTPEEQTKRNAEIALLQMECWNLATIEEKLGPVPAVIVRNALKGIVKTCQNFDGDHVDLEVVKKTVQLIGAENMLMMTDSIESKRLGGQQLHTQDGSSLLYQDSGIVAAGSKNIEAQIKNMFSIGLNVKQIEMLCSTNPLKIINQQQEYISAKADCV